MKSMRNLMIAILVVLAALSLAWMFGRGDASPTEEASPRVFIIGMDGADWNILNPLMEAGKLPHLAKLCEQGAYGILESIDPTLSPVIWTTLLTGRNRENHMITGFTSGEGSSLNLTSLQTRQVPALWDVCNEFGLSCGVVGPLLAWPAEPVQGFFVGDISRIEAAKDLDSSLNEGVYPPHLIPLMKPLVRSRDQLEDHQWLPMTRWTAPPALEARTHQNQRTRQQIDLLKSAIAKDLMTVDMAVELMKQESVDVCFVYLRATDTVCHQFWRDRTGENGPDSPFRETIDQVYEWTDQQIGRLLEGISDNTDVLIISDHGFKGMGMGDPITDHRIEGVLIWSGSSARKGWFEERVTILEAFPLIAWLAQLPLSEELDGRFPDELVRNDLLPEREVRKVPSYSNPRFPLDSETTVSEPPDAVINDLKALGYL